MSSSYLPKGYRTVTPYLICRGAAAALEFYKAAFGATEVSRFEHEGKIAHAEVRIGDSLVCVADEYPEMEIKSPQTVGGTPVQLLVYVADVDAVVERAVAAGAKITRPVADQFYGDRNGGVEDPFGHSWFIATHKEELSPEEIARRAATAK